MTKQKIEQKHDWFLRMCLGADFVAHSGRKLYDHLVGTHNLLASWGAIRDVCVAGLFHSVYGTNTFKRNCLDASRSDERSLLRFLIGERAEELVYLFGTINRPKVLIDASRRVRDEFRADTNTGLVKLEEKAGITISVAQLRDLLEIEAANLLEQNSKSERVLWSLAGALITDRARTALLLRLSVLDPPVQMHLPVGALDRVESDFEV